MSLERAGTPAQPAVPSTAFVRERRRGRWLDFAVFALALVLRIVAVLQYQAHHPNAEWPVIDEASYDRWARAIAGGDWIGREVFFQEPLYPYALGALYALFGPERIVIRLAQCVSWALAAVLVGRLARRTFGSAAGITAGFAIAIYGPGLLFPSLLLKENLFFPLLALLALLLVRSRTRRSHALWWGIGAVGALGALLRGNMLALLPVFALWPLARALFERKPFAPALLSAALILAGAACVLVPVAARNRAVGGVLVLTTSGAGTNLYGGNNAENPYGRATEFSFVRGIPEYEAGDWRHEAERRLGRALDPGEVSDYWKGEVLRSVRADPRMHLAILWNKLRLSLESYELPDNHLLAWDASFVPIARLPWPGFGLVGSLGLAGLALFALQRVWRRALAPFAVLDPAAAVELAALFGLYLATIVLTVTSDRARLPLVVPLACFAGHALVACARAVRARRLTAIMTAALALALAGWFVCSSALPAAEIAEDWDEREHNLAVQRLNDEGRIDDARAIAERLAARHPYSARVRTLLAEIEVRSAMAIDPRTAGPEAVLARRRALASALATVAPSSEDPRLSRRERFRAQHLAAWIELENGNWREAERRYRDALGFDPESGELRRGLARALIGASQALEEGAPRARFEEALAILRALRASAEPGDEANELDLLLSQADFFRGRMLRAGPPEQEAEKREGEAAIRSALERLRPIAESAQARREHSQRARVLAGWIQVHLGSLVPAENHFRKALELGPNPDAQLGLAQVLISAAEREASAEKKSARIEEAARLLGLVAASDPGSPAAVELRLRLENLR